jgi:PHD/YefM family antitoxin component YafN of YafNO toxin-antitoxin module
LIRKKQLQWAVGGLSMPSERFVGTSELQNNASLLLDDITTTGTTCYITQDGKAKAVLIDINRYNALMDLVEEAENPARADDAVAAETRHYSSVRTILKESARLAKKK